LAGGSVLAAKQGFGVIARLDRAIQYSRDGCDSPRGLWDTGSPAFAGDDSGEGVAQHSRGTICPGLVKATPPNNKRAQGMPGAGRTHGPPATKKAGGSHHRFSQIIRHSPRNGLRLIRALSGVPGLLASVACQLVTGRLDTSVGVPRPRDFTVRASFARPAKPARPSHPASRFVTIGRNVPRVEAGRWGEWDDFRFSAMAGGCGKVTRRAICAWRACMICPSRCGRRRCPWSVGWAKAR
jgi:hypothetical protein